MSKPGKSLKGLCKKLGVRLTVKRGKKRVYKSIKVLKRQCANKKKKRKVKRKRRKFGSGSRPRSPLSELMERESVEEFVEESFPNYQVYGGEGSRQELSFDTPVTNTKKRKDPDGGHARGNTDRGKRKIIKDLEVRQLDCDILTRMFLKENETRDIMKSLNQKKLIIQRDYDNIKTEYESVLDKEDKAVKKHSEEYNKLFHYLDGFYKKQDDDMTYEFKYIRDDNSIVLVYPNGSMIETFKDFCNNYKKVRNRTSFGRKRKVKRKKVKKKRKVKRKKVKKKRKKTAKYRKRKTK